MGIVDWDTSERPRTLTKLMIGSLLYGMFVAQQHAVVAFEAYAKMSIELTTDDID